MRRWRRRSRRREAADINITAFMNLMVVLVPFLLITAVFSRMAILELNLPESAEAAGAAEETFQLEVIVRQHAIEIGERSSGLMTVLPRLSTGHDYAGLTGYLQRVKAEFPDHSAATLLLEPDVAYDTLVQVMDAVRLYEFTEDGQRGQAELFPDISIGDAPAGARGG
ncbi:MAG: biopolymer transporter ExbD [Chromatiales bacterium]|nr:biopolymer transporter ExbD [Chromatiales bacterium]